MNCGISNDHIMRYFDGSLSDADSGKLKQHLKECGECRRLFESLDGILGSIRCEDMAEPPENFTKEVMAKVGKLGHVWESRSERVATFVYSAVTIFFAALLMVAIGIVKNMSFGGALNAIQEISARVAWFYSLAATIYLFIANIAGGVLQALFIIAKTYYHILLAMMVMALIIYNMAAGGLKRASNGGAG